MAGRTCSQDVEAPGNTPSLWPKFSCQDVYKRQGKAVAMSISTGTPLNQLSDEQFASLSDAYGTDARDVFELTKAFAPMCIRDRA